MIIILYDKKKLLTYIHEDVQTIYKKNYSSCILVKFPGHDFDYFFKDNIY